jgi:hypothetical protein
MYGALWHQQMVLAIPTKMQRKLPCSLATSHAIALLLAHQKGIHYTLLSTQPTLDAVKAQLVTHQKGTLHTLLSS